MATFRDIALLIRDGRYVIVHPEIFNETLPLTARFSYVDFHDATARHFEAVEQGWEPPEHQQELFLNMFFMFRDFQMYN